ncbi:hypothetical protein FQN54_001138 [Arachnomyces sp. PD_36]|nr:hypothetical protein FQN54_001138 [Arachnomyces sp. PD_36]
MAAYEVYSFDTSVQRLFASTSATRDECDEKAASLVGGRITPVPHQGDHSYTVYGGPQDESVVQFRLEPFPLSTEVATLARQVHGDLAPLTTYHGQLGNIGDRPVFVYTFNRFPGINYAEFQLANMGDETENSEENKVVRKNLIEDVARFFAASWKSPQPLDLEIKEELQRAYHKDLELLLQHLPERFHPCIQQCLDSISPIFALLPTVLLHNDLCFFHYMVDETSGRLTGVVEWATANIRPFGLNLFELHNISESTQAKNKRGLYEDHEAIHANFWRVFQDEVGPLSPEVIHAIEMARNLGLFRSRGFTRRLPTEPAPVPIKDDERGRYNLEVLDASLIRPQTRMKGLRDMATG